MIFNLDSTRKIIDREIKMRQALNPSFSASAFAKKVGMSQTYLSLLLKGERAVTKRVVEKLSISLNYSESQKQYLLLLAHKENTKDQDMQRALDVAVQELKRKHFPDSSYIKFFDVISEWHFSAIMEAIQLSGAECKSEAMIAKKLGLDPKLVNESLRTLLELKLVKKEQGRWVRIDSGFLKTTSEVQSEALRKFHKQVINMGLRAIDDQPIERRSFTGVTTAIDPAKIPEAKRRILEFQRDLMRFLEDGDRKEVYQFELQFFQLIGDYKEEV